MRDLITALGLALVIEGAVYALFPDRMRRLILEVSRQPSAALRIGGLAAAVLGFVIVWLMRGGLSAGGF
ncbi:MAG: DUF2065 domain-containing protein [Proteobacteria bacterium]|nr:DUF2065 domain-containing protein [Pseudomonadota bacterium]